ncbi:hypothetical protein ACI2OX_20380 [Bacillus sp. N9]
MLILDAMVDTGVISQRQADIAAKEELNFTGEHPHHRAESAPYFLMRYKRACDHRWTR